MVGETMAANVINKTKRPVVIPKPNVCNNSVRPIDNGRATDNYQNTQINNLKNKDQNIEQRLSDIEQYDLEQITERVDNLENKEAIHYGISEGDREDGTTWFQLIVE